MAVDMSPRYASVAEQTRVTYQIQQDPLSTDRTILANERTMLAYIRTAITLLAGSLSFINFFPGIATQILGWLILIPTGITLYIGAKRYYLLKKSITSHFIAD